MVNTEKDLAQDDMDIDDSSLSGDTQNLNPGYVNEPAQNLPGAGRAEEIEGGEAETLRLTEKMTDKQLAEFHKQEWINSYSTWSAANLGPNWVPQKVLGQGGYGIVGLWKWEGGEVPTGWPEYVVIKEATDGESLYREDAFLTAMEGRTAHIVQKYGTVYTDQPDDSAWTGVTRGKKSRMFLEYCNQGDLHQLIKRLMKSRPGLNQRIDMEVFTEKEAWTVFLHLSKAITAMERGSDNVDAPAWDITDRHLVHYDLKPANILVHGEQGNEQQIFKVSDFGLAQWVKLQDRQSIDYVKSRSGRGTSNFQPPEQTIFDMYNQDVFQLPDGTAGRASDYRLGPQCNVWNVGVIMLCLLTRVPFFYDIRWGMENIINDPEYVKNYSSSIRNLIAICVRSQWNKRLLPAGLQRAILLECHRLKMAIPTLTAPMKPFEPLFWRDPLNEGINRSPSPTYPKTKRSRSADDEDADIETQKKRKAAFQQSFSRQETPVGQEDPGAGLAILSPAPNQVRIFVAGRQDVLIRPTATLQALLQAIAGFQASEMQIRFQGTVLRDMMKTLQECGIVDGSEVRVVQIDPANFRVHVVFDDVPRKDDTPVATINKLSPASTVWDLQTMIARLGGKECGGIPRPTWGIHIRFNDTLLQHSMKTLRAYMIKDNSTVFVRQVGAPAIPPDPKESMRITTRSQEYGDDEQRIWKDDDIDLNSSMQDYLEVLAEALNWRVIYAVHVNRNKNVLLNKSLRENRVVNGCIIDVQGGPSPVRIHYGVQGTEEKGVFEPEDILYLNQTVHEYMKSLNAMLFQGRFKTCRLYAVNSNPADVDSRGRVMHDGWEMDTAMGQLPFEGGSDIFTSWTLPRIFLVYKDLNQREQQFERYVRLDMNLGDFVRQTLQLLGLNWDAFVVQHVNQQPAKGLNHTLVENGAVHQCIIAVQQDVGSDHIRGIIIRRSDANQPGGFLSRPLKPQHRNTQLRAIIVDPSLQFLEYKIITIDGLPPAADMGMIGRQTLVENKVKDHSVIDIAPLIDNSALTGSQSGALQATQTQVNSLQTVGQLNPLQTWQTQGKNQEIIASQFLQWINDETQRMETHFIWARVPVNTDINEFLLHNIRARGLPWTKFAIAAINKQKLTADIQRTGKTFADYNLKTGCLIEVERLQDDYITILTLVYDNEHGERKGFKIQDKTISADDRIMPILWDYIRRVGLKWANFAVRSINGREPAGNVGTRGWETLRENAIRNGAMIFIAPKEGMFS